MTSPARTTLKILMRRKRRERELSLREMGKLLNVPWTNISKIEKGKTKSPQFHNVMRFCKLFKIDPWSIR